MGGNPPIFFYYHRFYLPKTPYLNGDIVVKTETKEDKLLAELTPILMSPEEIKPWSKNPKKHDHQAIEQSMDRFGVRWPIIVQSKTNRIIAGHGRLEGFKKKGLTTVPVLKYDCTDEEANAFAVVDNQTTILGGWNKDQLRDVLNSVEIDNYDLKGLFDESDFKIPSLEIVENKPEMEFTQELLESHNYVILYFDNDIDWQTAKEVFGIKTKKALDSKPGYERCGLGRVLPGADILRRLKNEPTV